MFDISVSEQFAVPFSPSSYVNLMLALEEV